MLPDETSQDVLTNREAGSALAVAFARAGRKEPIDMIFSDTCLNGAVEVFAELQEFAQVIVASPFSVPGHGWQYELFIEWTASEKPVTSQDWALLAVKLYGAMYPSIDGDIQRLRERQLAAFSTKPDLVKAFAKVVKALMAMEPKAANALMTEATIRRAEQVYGNETSLDIRQLVRWLHELTESSSLKEVCSSFLAVFDKALVGVSGQPYQDFPMSGLSIWVPTVWSDSAGVGGYYSKLLFAKKTKWLQCLKHVFPERAFLQAM